MRSTQERNPAYPTSKRFRIPIRPVAFDAPENLNSNQSTHAVAHECDFAALQLRFAAQLAPNVLPSVLQWKGMARPVTHGCIILDSPYCHIVQIIVEPKRPINSLARYADRPCAVDRPAQPVKKDYVTLSKFSVST